MDRIHLESPKGWINDPNGFIYYNGRYHLFYQHFPYAPQWGRMHWGHAVSDDLSSWEHLDIALFPTKTADADGCFSGSAIEHDGVMYLFYTGVQYDTPNPENTNCSLDDRFTSSQLVIASKDGYSFDNFNGKRVVVPPIVDENMGDRINTRDPKVWRGSDAWYMVLGTTVNHRGRLLFYRSYDLMAWEYVNHAGNDKHGWMWECPDYFEVDGQGVLIFSPMGLEEGNQACCALVSFHEERCEMTIPDKLQFLDYGFDLYAPQSTEDAQGRRTVIAWMRSPESPDGTSIGMFCIPRVCEVRNGHVCFAPHPDVRNQFTQRIDSPQEATDGQYKFVTSLADGEQIDAGGYRIERRGNRIHTDRTKVLRNHTECRMVCETPEIAEGFEIEVFVSPNMIETYVNGGEYVITNAVYDLGNEIVSGRGTELFTIK